MLFADDEHVRDTAGALSQFSTSSDGEVPLESLNTSLGANVIPVSRLNDEMSCIDDTAQGSFGVVRRGMLDVDKRWYAVKQTKKEISGEGDLQQRLQEVYALGAFNHPNIVRYFDAWVEDKAVFMRTELVPHGPIGAFERPVEERLVVSVLHQIASALHLLHTHGVLHRDVKPENILARRIEDDASGDVQYTFKLCDFGLARPARGTTSLATGEVFKGINDDDGDRNYLCPEAFTACDALHIGPKADVYALGASCVELMGGDPGEVRHGRYTLDGARYSRELKHLVCRMTTPNPDDRPDAFMVMRETLDHSIRKRDSVASRLQYIDALRSRIQALRSRSINPSETAPSA